MYATIEPRLIALLNDGPPSEPFVPYTRLDLPPLDNNILKSSGRPPPLEPDTNSRSVKRSALGAHQNVPYDRDTGKGSTGRVLDGNIAPQASSITGRALGDTSPQSLRKILEDVPDAPQSQSSKRKQRTDNSKDEYFQLPQPVKKQKAKQVVPPIIIGLFEPPPIRLLYFLQLLQAPSTTLMAETHSIQDHQKGLKLRYLRSCHRRTSTSSITKSLRDSSMLQRPGRSGRKRRQRSYCWEFRHTEWETGQRFSRILNTNLMVVKLLISRIGSEPVALQSYGGRVNKFLGHLRRCEVEVPLLYRTRSLL